MSSDYIGCEYLAKPEDITELEPCFDDGSEYLIRVVFKSGDRQWGEYMTAKATALARVLFASALALLVLLPGLAVAQPKPPHVNGQETVGQFRDWPESLQLGYVLGVRSYASMMGLRCPVNRTNGEMLAALKYNNVLQASDSLPKAIFLIELRDGCQIEEAAR